MKSMLIAALTIGTAIAGVVLYKRSRRGVKGLNGSNLSGKSSLSGTSVESNGRLGTHAMG